MFRILILTTLLFGSSGSFAQETFFVDANAGFFGSYSKDLFLSDWNTETYHYSGTNSFSVFGLHGGMEYRNSWFITQIKLGINPYFNHYIASDRITLNDEVAIVQVDYKEIILTFAPELRAGISPEFNNKRIFASLTAGLTGALGIYHKTSSGQVRNYENINGEYQVVYYNHDDPVLPVRHVKHRILINLRLVQGYKISDQWMVGAELNVNFRPYLVTLGLRTRFEFPIIQ